MYASLTPRRSRTPHLLQSVAPPGPLRHCGVTRVEQLWHLIALLALAARTLMTAGGEGR